MYHSRFKNLGLSPFHFACAFSNRTQIIDDMLTNGADIDEVSKCGSALCIAAIHGKTDMVRHFLRRGARIGQPGPVGYSELLIAADRGHSETCKVLIEHGADVNQKHPITKASALATAVMEGHHDTLLTLLSLGAEINSRSENGLTSLATATEFGRLVHLISLLQAGADPSLPDKNGAPPTHKAAQVDNVSALRVLLEHGCDKEQVKRTKEIICLNRLLFSRLTTQEGLLSWLLRFQVRTDVWRYYWATELTQTRWTRMDILP